MPEIVLVRHGETEWSLNGRHTGRTDIPLTPTGREQARALGGSGSRVGEWRFDRVFTSPLKRAMETCQLAGLGGQAGIRDELMEWDYGDYEGRTTPDIRVDRPGCSLWDHGVPEGEQVGDVAARVDRLLGELGAVEDRVALVSHGHLLRVLAARWIGLAPEQGRHFALATATVSVLGFERTTRVITSWNLGGDPSTPA